MSRKPKHRDEDWVIAISLIFVAIFTITIFGGL